MYRRCVATTQRFSYRDKVVSCKTLSIMWKVTMVGAYLSILQDKLRMETLRCRAYTRQRLREEGREVEEMESRVLDAQQQLTAVNRENRRLGQGIYPHSHCFSTACLR